MSTIALGRQHPYYWVATSLLGLSDSALARAVGVSTQAVNRWAFGHNPSDEVLGKLRRFIEERMATDAYNNQSPREIPELLHRKWYKLTFKLINQYLKEYAPAAQRPRISALQREIAALLPARRMYVLAQLQRSHSIRSIERAARIMGLEEVMEHDQLTWRSPPSTPTRRVQKTTALFVPARTKRGGELQDLIILYLSRKHDKGIEKVRSTRLLAHCLARGHARPSIYRAFKDLCLLSKTSGFGKDKRTYYALPHDKEEHAGS